jgi:hypothetical protein
MSFGSCERCGTRFERTRPQKRFCSERCQGAAECRRYRIRRTETATCPRCDTTFERSTTTKRVKVYCSLDCQYEARSAECQERADIKANLKRAELVRRRKTRASPPTARFTSCERPSVPRRPRWTAAWDSPPRGCPLSPEEAAREPRQADCRPRTRDRAEVERLHLLDEPPTGRPVTRHAPLSPLRRSAGTSRPRASTPLLRELLKGGVVDPVPRCSARKRETRAPAGQVIRRGSQLFPRGAGFCGRACAREWRVQPRFRMPNPGAGGIPNSEPPWTGARPGKPSGERCMTGRTASSAQPKRGDSHQTAPLSPLHTGLPGGSIEARTPAAATESRDNNTDSAFITQNPVGSPGAPQNRDRPGPSAREAATSTHPHDGDEGCEVSALLQKPGGLEGFVFLMGKEALHPSRETIVVERPDGPAPDIQLDAAARSSGPDVLTDQDLVALNAEPAWLDLLLLEGVGLHPRPQRVRASQRRLAARGMNSISGWASSIGASNAARLYAS